MFNNSKNFVSLFPVDFFQYFTITARFTGADVNCFVNYDGKLVFFHVITCSLEMSLTSLIM